jgi:hypothetical protein
MTMYDRDSSSDCQTIDQWDSGVGWIAHPDEEGYRASHAIVGDNGDVWVIDPIDAPGVDDLLADLGTGEVAGVAVLSSYHARDAGVIADRYDVPVYLPQWMDRVEERIDAPVERYSETLGESGFQVRKCKFPGYYEAIAYRESDRTLYIPDVLGTAPLYTVGDERIGVYLIARLFPPREMDGFVPERILVGHGTGIFEDAAAALTDAITGARRRFPNALMTSGRTQLRAVTAALEDGMLK